MTTVAEILLPLTAPVNHSRQQRSPASRRSHSTTEWIRDWHIKLCKVPVIPRRDN
jgi:hypothetical protein